jgi:hypothetical protein
VRWGLLLLGLGLLHGPCAAQFQAVPGQEYREVVDPKRPVSGHAIVGLSLVGGAPGRLLNVYLAEPVRPGTPLRVELDSPDGRFHGSGLFDGSAPGGAWVPVTLLPDDQPTRRPADLADDELAVSVRTVDADGRHPARSLVASWATPDPRSATLRLHVNSRRATMQVRGRAGGERRACRKVRSASTVRFDTVCEIPVAELEPLGDGRHRLTLLRRDGFASEPMQVEVRL